MTTHRGNIDKNVVDGDYQLQLPDSAGANSWNVLDSNGAVVFKIDSNGNLTASGAISGSSTLEASSYISTSAETSISGVDTPAEVAGTFTSILASSGMTVGTDGRITNNTGTTHKFVVDARFSITCAGNNKDVTVYVAKNGSVITASANERTIGTGSDIGSGSVLYPVSLDDGDYCSIFVENNTDSVNITMRKLVLLVKI